MLLLSTAGSAIGAGKLVAALLTTDMNRYRDSHRAFVKSLAQRGYDHNNLEIVVQNPNPDPVSWANSARKFKAIGADIIVTYGAPATIAAMREVSNIPIIFADVYSPVETGITRSLTQTGRNITGISSKVPMSTLIKAYRDIRPLKSLGVLYSSREVGSVVQLKEIKRIAAQEGFAVVEANVLSIAGLDAAMNNLLSRADCIYVSEATSASRNLDKILHRATQARIPVISQIPDSSDKGVLLSLEANTTEQGQLAAEYAANILAGKKPGQMPISTPKKVELIANLKAAKNLEVTFPIQVLGMASKIIR